MGRPCCTPGIAGNGIGAPVRDAQENTQASRTGHELVIVDWLPLMTRRVEQKLRRHLSSRAHPRATTPRAHPPMARVLIAEDEPDHFMVLEFALNTDGHTLQHAPDGPTALAMAQEQHFDLIVLDVRLPAMNGLEVARQLRAARAPDANTKILMISGLAWPEDIEQGLAAGADIYLPKPFSIRDLRTTVTSLLT